MPNQPHKILIAEDDRPMAKALELKLINSGFNTKVAYDGEEAINLLKGETFDLVLLDLIMPIVDGFGVLADMKTRNDKTPVIVLTNLSQEEDMQKTKALGALDYIVKSDTPITHIIEYIKRILMV